jgi:hypothetical protein
MVDPIKIEAQLYADNWKKLCHELEMHPTEVDPIALAHIAMQYMHLAQMLLATVSSASRVAKIIQAEKRKTYDDA